MDICVDFDGTCVYHEYPSVGDDIPGAVDVLHELVKKGHRLILFTMRSGTELAQAVAWFKIREIPLYGINTNPTQLLWTTSPKAHCQLFIDDVALGCPTTIDPIKSSRPYVDWSEVKLLLKSKHIL